MKWIILALCLVAFALADGDVFILTDENFDKTIASNSIVMVKFFAPWCGHCKALAPEYEKLAKTVKESGKKYVIAELDATVQKATAGKFGVNGYPTLKLFIDGTPIDYEGERKLDDILAFINKKSIPSSLKLTTDQELKDKVDSIGRRVSCVE